MNPPITLILSYQQRVWNFRATKSKAASQRPECYTRKYSTAAAENGIEGGNDEIRFGRRMLDVVDRASTGGQFGVAYQEQYNPSSSG
jgi:hypothetical protein